MAEATAPLHRAPPPDLKAAVTTALARLAAGLGERGEDRAGQVAMAEAVARAVRDRVPLAVQAGTGTGKSWAYLVGALVGLRARAPGGPGGRDAPEDGGGEGDGEEAGRRVVVATATRALQDQLAGQDLPAVAGVVDGGVRFAVLKGRSNYLCRQAAAEALTGPVPATLDLDGSATPGDDRQGDGDGPRGDGPRGDGGGDGGGDGDGAPSAVGAEVLRLVAWADTTATGDRAELDFEPQPAAWGAVSVSASECPGAQACPSGDRCFAEAAYERARAAEVVVVNLHLYGAHVASGGHVLPDHEVVVIDEAHDAEDVMVNALGVTLTPNRARVAARSARAVLGGTAGRSAGLLRSGDTLAAALAPLVGRRLAGGAKAAEAVATALDALGEAARQVQGELRALEGLGDAGPRRDRAVRVLAALVADAEAARTASDDDTVTWVEQANSQPALRVAPIDVGAELARVAWPAATGVLTSATLPPGVAARLGLGRAATLDVGSPFDYRHHALLYVPRLPDPRQPGHEAAAHAELRALIEAAGGRTLALFTSWRAMRAAAAAVAADLPYPVLVQNDLPKPALVARFRADEASCLFATMGFWQGVDVPGSACSLVVVDRIPFPRPDDPLFEARRERAGPAAFAAVDLPHAATRLAQGVGRLIRSSTDRGVVAVLDSRLAERDYRRVILAALPPMRRTRERDDVVAFFASGRPANMVP